MPDETPTTSRDVFTTVRPLLTHLIYAAAGAWLAATVLTARFPTPTVASPPQPNTGVVRVVIDSPPHSEQPTCPDVVDPGPHDSGPRDSGPGVLHR